MARTSGSDGKKTRGRIEAKALELIARHGFEALTMRQLAAASGVQAGALYYYFPDKQALLRNLIEAHLSELLAASEGRGEGGPSEQLTGFARRHILFHVSRRHAGHVANNELRSLNRANLAAALKQRGLYEKRLRQILKDGQEAGVFEIADPALMTMGVLAFLNEVCVWFRDGGPLPLEAMADEFSSAALRMALAR